MGETRISVPGLSEDVFFDEQVDGSIILKLDLMQTSSEDKERM